jgi:hypothetical protein
VLTAVVSALDGLVSANRRHEEARRASGAAGKEYDQADQRYRSALREADLARAAARGALDAWRGGCDVLRVDYEAFDAVGARWTRTSRATASPRRRSWHRSSRPATRSASGCAPTATSWASPAPGCGGCAGHGSTPAQARRGKGGRAGAHAGHPGRPPAPARARHRARAAVRRVRPRRAARGGRRPGRPFRGGPAGLGAPGCAGRSGGRGSRVRALLEAHEVGDQWICPAREEGPAQGDELAGTRPHGGACGGGHSRGAAHGGGTRGGRGERGWRVAAGTPWKGSPPPRGRARAVPGETADARSAAAVSKRREPAFSSSGRAAVRRGRDQGGPRPRARAGSGMEAVQDLPQLQALHDRLQAARREEQERERRRGSPSSRRRRWRSPRARYSRRPPRSIAPRTRRRTSRAAPARRWTPWRSRCARWRSWRAPPATTSSA